MTENEDLLAEGQNLLYLFQVGIPAHKEPVFMPEGSYDKDIEQVEQVIKLVKDLELLRRLRVIRNLMIGRSWEWILTRHKSTHKEMITWVKAWNIGGFTCLFLLGIPKNGQLIFPPQRQFHRANGHDIYLGDEHPRLVILKKRPVDPIIEEKLKQAIDDLRAEVKS